MHVHVMSHVNVISRISACRWCIVTAPQVSSEFVVLRFRTLLVSLLADAEWGLAASRASRARTMDDPSQSAAQAAGRQDRALQEKYRATLQEGAMTGFAERNTKWDVEYEGKDAKGQLVRPFEPGFGDARALPGKMLGETNIMAVMRSMGRDMPHSGAGDGKKVFKTEENPALLKKMLREEQEKDAPPPLPRLAKNIKKQGVQQSRLEYQFSVGLHGGTFGMHTREFVTAPYARASRTQKTAAPLRPSTGCDRIFQSPSYHNSAHICFRCSLDPITLAQARPSV